MTADQVLLTPSTPHPGRPHTTQTLLVLGLAALAFALAQTTLTPAIPELALALHTSAGNVAWALTGYFAAAAVCTPLVGRLGDMFGKKRLLVIALLAFSAGSIVAAVSSDIWIVVAGRVIMGVGGGIFPLCFPIIRDEFPRARVGRRVGRLSALAAIGGGVGLVLGGLIVDHISYHWIFWLGAVMGLAAAVGARFLIAESPVRTPGRIDLAGAVVLAVGLVLPLIAISEAHQWGWTSARTLGMTAAGLLILVGWVGLERRTEQPLADISALTKPPVLITNLATLLVGFGMFGSFVLVPQLAETPVAAGYGLGFDATKAGLLLLPGSILMLALGPLSGILGSRVGNKVPLALGGLAASLGLLLLAVAHGSAVEIISFGTLMFAGIGLGFAAMPNLIIDAVPSEQTGEATGFNALVRSVGSSVGTQVSATILTGSIATGSRYPRSAAYTHAFLVSAAVALVAGIAAAMIPRARPRVHAPALDEVGAAAPLAEPALVIEPTRDLES